jgi:hypothetical protein
MKEPDIIRELNDDIGVLRIVGIDPERLTPAEIRKVARLLGQITIKRCYSAASNARRPKALEELDTFLKAREMLGKARQSATSAVRKGGSTQPLVAP